MGWGTRVKVFIKIKTAPGMPRSYYPHCCPLIKGRRGSAVHSRGGGGGFLLMDSSPHLRVVYTSTLAYVHANAVCIMRFAWCGAFTVYAGRISDTKSNGLKTQNINLNKRFKEKRNFKWKTQLRSAVFQNYGQCFFIESKKAVIKCLHSGLNHDGLFTQQSFDHYYYY